MNPKQREAVERLINEYIAYDEVLDWPAEAAALLRELAAELVQEPGVEYKRGYEAALNDCIRNGVEWARSMFANNAEHIKPAEPQGEPVAWIDSNGCPHHLTAIQTATEKRLYGPWSPLFDHPPQQRKPLDPEVRATVQQAALALKKLDGPGYLIGGVMHYRIGLILPKLNAAIDAIAAHGIGEPT